MNIAGYSMAEAAADDVYEQSGLGPDDLDVIELHDCFSADELITSPGADPAAPCRIRGFEPDGNGVHQLEYCDFLVFDGQTTHGGSIAAGTLRQ